MSSLEKNNAINQLNEMLDALRDAKEYGSILNVPVLDWDLLRRYSAGIDESGQMEMMSIGADETLEAVKELIDQAQAMAQKYHTAITNPPYMGSSGMSFSLSAYVKDCYPDSKSDLFAIFMERIHEMMVPNGYQAMITQHARIFLSSFEKLREKLQMNTYINLVHLGARAFEEIGGEVVQTASFVLRNGHSCGYRGTYCRLLEPTTQQGKENMFLSGEKRYIALQDSFPKVPGAPIAYWISDTLINSFSSTSLDNHLTFRQGMTTTNNEKYLRFWYEVDAANIGFGMTTRQDSIHSGKMWFPYQKGGEYRKWYGNNIYTVFYFNDGIEMVELVRKKYPKISDPEFIIKNRNWYFLEGLTWSTLSSANIGVRYVPTGFVFDAKGSMAFTKSDNSIFGYIALLNSNVAMKYLDVLAPTMDFNIIALKALPFLIDQNKAYYSEIEKLTIECISISRTDWDSFETSWDFQRHPMVRYDSTVEDVYSYWALECSKRFEQLKSNEEELNRIFIDIYGLQDELTPEVADKDVTVRKADLGRDVRSLISYAVGCMLGRYSLDTGGLVYAGGDWEATKYSSFIPDADNCIPITDEPYFEDDIVGRFVDFIRTVYGSETLEKNLDFIANALGSKGNTSREVIRNYFLNDFIKDHIKLYQKRPIYWLFDSGKHNGFKALVYMHRWNADTVGNLRVEYLHRMQRVYEKEIERMQDIIDNSKDNREVNQASKRHEKLVKQLKEARDYDAKIAHVALSRVEINLDDGVKINYEKVQKGPDGKSLGILAKI